MNFLGRHGNQQSGQEQGRHWLQGAAIVQALGFYAAANIGRTEALQVAKPDDPEPSMRRWLVAKRAERAVLRDTAEILYETKDLVEHERQQLADSVENTIDLLDSTRLT